MPEQPATRSTIDISWAAIAKVLAAIAMVWVWLKLVTLVMVMVISILIAVAVDPVVGWLERRRIPRWLGSVGCILLLAGVVLALLMDSWSSISQQGRLIAQSLANLYQHFKASFPALERLLPGSGQVGRASLQEYGAAFAMSLFRALMLVTVGMILTVYLLIEWKRTLEWLIAFVPKGHRAKVRLTLFEARAIMFGYVAGNVATSIFAAIFVFVALTLLKVPAALLLALLAGVFDFVPVLGFALSGVPAVVLAATVSPATAVLVVGLYIMYHFIENYFIAPKVYGTELRLSNLAVLIAFAVGAELAGVIGALLALPIAAAYPAVERIWLSERLAADTVETHQTLEQTTPPA
jgi:predicted PurR-regulated permease PerM